MLKSKSKFHSTVAGLHRRAEIQLRVRRNGGRLGAALPKSAADARRLYHELQVHQVEVEMQNAELRQARDELEVTLENYTDLYDFAPVGYFTLTATGAIKQANLTGASLVGIERSQLVGRLFGLLLTAGTRSAFQAFLQQVFAGRTKQSSEFEILRAGQPPRFVSLEAQRSLNGQECRAAVMDISARHQAEAKVRVSEIRFRRLFETAHDGVLLLDPTTRKITDANPFMTQLLGYPHAELVGKELYEIGLLQDESASRAMFEELKRNRSVRYEDLPLESREGRHQEVEVVANLYQEDGRPVIQCNIRDITERKQAELALIRLASIVESSDDAIIGKDLNGIVNSWNTGAEKIFGYTAREMVGTPLLRLIPARLREEEKQILWRIKRGKGVQHFETLRRTKGGRLINVSITSSPIRDASGRIIGASKVARDITLRKQAEEMLRRNEALFSSLIEQAPLGVYVVDAKFRLQQVNPGALAIFRNIHPLIGRDFSELHHILWPKRVSDRVIKRFRHTLRTGEPYHAPEFSERRRDTGATEVYEWQIQRLTLPGGEYGVVAFFNDITERKQAEVARRRLAVLTASNQKLEREIVRRRVVEESLRKSESQQRHLLEQSRHLQGQLRHLSHQILGAQEEERKRISRELHDVIAQTLVGINIHLAALTREAAGQSDRFQQKLGRTQRLVEESVQVVHQFARELRPTMLDDLGLIPALHAFMKNFTAHTGVRTSLTTFATVEQLDMAQRTVLFRVTQEALTNVARHAQASRAEVSIQKLPDGTCLEIKDNGKSFGVDRVWQRKGGGRLGLLGMRERLEMVGGKLSVESAPGKGTVVRAQIPLRKSRVQGSLLETAKSGNPTEMEIGKTIKPRKRRAPSARRKRRWPTAPHRPKS